MIDIFFIILIGAILLGVAGQLFLKKGMIMVGKTDIRPKYLIHTVYKMFSNRYVLFGSFIFGLSTILWIAAISRLDLSFAYPMVSISYVLTAFLSHHFFNEKIRGNRWFSISLICVGVIIIAFS